MAGADPFTAFANALSSIFNFGQPILEDHLAQKNEKDAHESTEKWQQILSQSDSDERADDLHAFQLKLCIDAGQAPGELSGRLIRVPVEILHALTLSAIRKIKTDRDLNAATFALQKKR